MSNEQPPSGQPQPRNPLRAALERFGRERRGQPQPRAEYLEPIQPHAFVASMVGPDCRVCVAPASNAIHVGDPISRSVQRRLGQPQQEPACPCLHEGHECEATSCEDCLRFNHEVFVLGTQERQAGGHVHERGQERPNLRTVYARYFRCRHCDYGMDENEWRWYERGVADAAAQQ